MLHGELNMPLLNIPESWTVRGEIPAMDAAAASEDELALFDEDMLQVVDESGAFTLDVGWYPAGNPDGRFILRAVLSNDWESPLEEVETQERANVTHWLEAWLQEIRSRLGEPYAILETDITTVMIPEIGSGRALSVPAEDGTRPIAMPQGDGFSLRPSHAS